MTAALRRQTNGGEMPHYSFCCLSCKSSEGFWESRSALADIWEHRAVLIQAGNDLEERGNWINVKFLIAHDNHDVVIEDEHDRREGDCGEYFMPLRGAWKRFCRAPKDHPVGEHRINR